MTNSFLTIRHVNLCSHLTDVQRDCVEKDTKMFIFQGEMWKKALFFQKKHNFPEVAFLLQRSVGQWNFGKIPFLQCSWYQLFKNPIPKFLTIPAQSWDIWVQVIAEISQNWMPPASLKVAFLFWEECMSENLELYSIFTNSPGNNKQKTPFKKS